MSEGKLLGQLEAAQRKAAQLEQQRAELIDTQAQAAAELDTVLEEEKATAALARSRVAGNRLAIVERDLAQAQQSVKDLDLQILRAQIVELEQQKQLGLAEITQHLVKVMDLAEDYAALSSQLVALQEKTGDTRWHSPDQRGAWVREKAGSALQLIGWTVGMTADNRKFWTEPKQAVKA